MKMKTGKNRANSEYSDREKRAEEQEDSNRKKSEMCSDAEMRAERKKKIFKCK